MNKKELNPNAVEMITGEKPKDKELQVIDTETPAEEILAVEEPSKTDIVEDEILRLIFNKDNLPMTTDLSRRSAVTMARATIIADEFHCDKLHKFINDVKEHLVSNKRKGREELIKVASSFRDDVGMGMESEEESISDKIWSKNR